MDNLDAASLIKKKSAIELLVKKHSEKLNEFPQFSNGLVPDEVRNTEKYKFHKSEFEKHFKALQEFNGNLTNYQKKEMSKYKRLNKE